MTARRAIASVRGRARCARARREGGSWLLRRIGAGRLAQGKVGAPEDLRDARAGKACGAARGTGWWWRQRSPQDPPGRGEGRLALPASGSAACGQSVQTGGRGDGGGDEAPRRGGLARRKICVSQEHSGQADRAERGWWWRRARKAKDRRRVMEMQDAEDWHRASRSPSRFLPPPPNARLPPHCPFPA